MISLRTSLIVKRCDSVKTAKFDSFFMDATHDKKNVRLHIGFSHKNAYNFKFDSLNALKRMHFYDTKHFCWFFFCVDFNRFRLFHSREVSIGN